MPAGEMPDIEKFTSDDVDLDVTGSEGVKAILVRQFAHDLTSCDQTRDLLTALGLTHGSDEGYEMDHMASHDRIERVMPLELLLMGYSQVLGTVAATAMIEAKGAVDSMAEHSILFAEQNAEVVLHSARAIIGHLMAQGVLVYGPAAMFLQDPGTIG